MASSISSTPPVLEDDLDNYGFTPNIQAAGFQMNKPDAGVTFIDNLRFNREAEIFADSFESGDLSNWEVIQ